MSSASPLVWFLLLDSATGLPYKNTSASSVLRSSLVVPVVDQFRDAVHVKYANKASAFTWQMVAEGRKDRIASTSACSSCTHLCITCSGPLPGNQVPETFVKTNGTTGREK